MAKIKHTKTELKAQREALSRFERFLPMLQLKKQQLQAEIQVIEQRMSEKLREREQLRGDVARWVSVFAEPVGVEDMLNVSDIITDEGNIAGVRIPILQDVKTQRADVDLFETPPWIDDAMDTTEKLIRLRVEHEILDEQKRLVSEELRTTSQRVNLFEKVKIPECRENIRVIKIFLGDEQTAAVVRGKIAKRRSE